MNVLVYVTALIIIENVTTSKVNITSLRHNGRWMLLSTEQSLQPEDHKALVNEAVIKAGKNLDDICDDPYSQYGIYLEAVTRRLAKNAALTVEETIVTSFVGDMFFYSRTLFSSCDMVAHLRGEISVRVSPKGNMQMILFLTGGIILGVLVLFFILVCTGVLKCPPFFTRRFACLTKICTAECNGNKTNKENQVICLDIVTDSEYNKNDNPSHELMVQPKERQRIQRGHLQNSKSDQYGCVDLGDATSLIKLRRSVTLDPALNRKVIPNQVA